jgi:hypothetical protein
MEKIPDYWPVFGGFPLRVFGSFLLRFAVVFEVNFRTILQ